VIELTTNREIKMKYYTSTATTTFSLLLLLSGTALIAGNGNGKLASDDQDKSVVKKSPSQEKLSQEGDEDFPKTFDVAGVTYTGKVEDEKKEALPVVTTIVPTVDNQVQTNAPLVKYKQVRWYNPFTYHRLFIWIVDDKEVNASAAVVVPSNNNEVHIQSLDKASSIKFTRTGNEEEVLQSEIGTRVRTKPDNYAHYQLVSDTIQVKPGQAVKVSYKITVDPEGVMSIGFLNTARNGWYGDEIILKEGTHSGTLDRVVPDGDTETSIVFRNYHLDKVGQTTFTIEALQFGDLPVIPNASSNSTVDTSSDLTTSVLGSFERLEKTDNPEVKVLLEAAKEALKNDVNK
jgi:hypothetical protein